MISVEALLDVFVVCVLAGKRCQISKKTNFLCCEDVLLVIDGKTNEFALMHGL